MVHRSKPNSVRDALTKLSAALFTRAGRYEQAPEYQQQAEQFGGNFRGAIRGG